jgi:hypothetical protein
MYPPNIANVANISHITLALGHVLGTTGITVLPGSALVVWFEVSAVVLVVPSIKPFVSEIVNSFISHQSHGII